MAKKILSLVIVILVLVTAGCGNQAVEKPVESSVMSEADILAYMKEKYGEDFKIIEYAEDDINRPEDGIYNLSLIDGTCEADIFPVFLSDDATEIRYEAYIWIQLQEPLAKYITENTEQFAGNGEFKIIVIPRSTSLNEVPEDFEDMEHSIGALVYLYFYGTEEELESYTSSMEEWLSEHDFVFTVRPYLLSENIVDNINRENHKNIDKTKIVAYESFTLEPKE